MNKPWLIFLIDEGFKWDIISRTRDNYPLMEKYLDNICEALEGLQEKYKVAALIYPNQFYNKEAYGKKNPSDLDRIHPAFQHFMSYFEKRMAKGLSPVYVFVEMYSSGVCTGQNSELGELEAPPFRRNGTDKHLGLPMDMDAASALKKAFPKSFAGIRFHEIYGSDLVIKFTDRHGFFFEEEVVRECIDLCAENDLVLYWSDSNWIISTTPCVDTQFVNDANYKPYFESEPYNSLQKYAFERLGENIIFSYANNSFCLPNNLERIGEKALEAEKGEGEKIKIGDIAPFETYKNVLEVYDYLKFDTPYSEHPLKSEYPNNWGVSDQSWFWSEMNHVLGYKKYYSYNDDECPVEIMAAFALRALKEGTRGVQFEPNWYFFNVGTVTEDSILSHEGVIDCSARTNMLRLKEMLLTEDETKIIAKNPNDFLDKSLQKLIENDAANPPVNYLQNTLHVFGSAGYPVSYCNDFYSNGKSWISGQPYRVPANFNNKEVFFSTRFAVDSSGSDLIMLVTGGEKYRAELFRANGVYMGTNELFLNNGKHLLALCAGNIRAKEISDDILSVYESEGKLSLNAHNIKQVRFNDLPSNYSFDKVENDNAYCEINTFISELNPSAFEGMGVMRVGASVYENDIRIRDAVYILYKENGKLLCKLFNSEIKAAQQIDVNYDIIVKNKLNKILVSACIDVDNDGIDEILILTKESLVLTWHIFKYVNQKLVNVGIKRDFFGENYLKINTVCGYRKTIFSKAVLDKNSNFPVRHDAFV